jgi:hypothetical protein
MYSWFDSTPRSLFEFERSVALDDLAVNLDERVLDHVHDRVDVDRDPVAVRSSGTV